MIQVKIFDEGKSSNLEKSINGFLELKQQNDSFKLIDIKYNAYNYGENRTDYHSAVIIYED
ncbi:sporulation protein Cse60 [Lysinibacillus sphaericus]|uniref:DUF2758 domain-containing protein n=1 Tax=Lysinibacillus sphaericus TaxID=1421 RepID=A0A2S0K071_LYSSH|nr:sporulation protein Cse60 [Lysinibacillus sphaericus]AVK96708.1 DUF2758 domain-containing protein [Lysinibacillus sphaericus]MED4543060.1 sporulation protein Cse60 [Lysinibacillus sphaericus]TKI16399.1 sporulation protein Cse60 [Lysinibacillus sphaericus]SUV17476.1 protein YteV [Lysinibacillus sphaericus]GEC83962.1 hypothetical protein LSP03_37050 [Lysinibacillus sphaericus]